MLIHLVRVQHRGEAFEPANMISWGTIMALSGKEIYKHILPKTNCGDCGIASCYTFATTVVANKVPLATCPHIDPVIAARYQAQLDSELTEDSIHVRKDMAAEALEWARKRCTSMNIEDIHKRIGGVRRQAGDQSVLELPYFQDAVIIRNEGITRKDGPDLTPWEKVFIYNHMAQGGSSPPTGTWIALQDIPNTTPKLQTMKTAVEGPLIKRFGGRLPELGEAVVDLGGTRTDAIEGGADAAFIFHPLPQVPVMLLFWDKLEDEGFPARCSLLFDKTIPEHLDIESIMFLCEKLCQLLCGDD